MAAEVEALRGEVAANEETLTDCLTSLGQEEAKVGEGCLPGGRRSGAAAAPCWFGVTEWRAAGPLSAPPGTHAPFPP